jgi:hypothetical protein
MRRTLPLGTLVVGLLAAAPALAAPTAEALLEQGVRRYQQGQVQQSLAVLKRAAELATEPAIQIKVQLYLGFGACVLGRQPEAEAAFKQALTLDPTLSLDPAEIKSSIIDVFNHMRSTMMGELEVTADRSGARVSLDGVDRGPAPFKGKAPIGKHRLAVATADGLYRHAQEVLIGAVHAVTVNARLELLGGHLEVTSVPSGARVLVDGRELGRTPLRAAVLPAGRHQLEVLLAGHIDQVRAFELRARETARVSVTLQPFATAEPPKRKRVWTWVAAGTAAAMGAAGLGLGLWARSSWNDYQAAALDGKSATYHELHDAIPKRALAANVCFGVAGAALVAAVVLFFVEKPEKRPPAAKAVSGLLGGWSF